MLECRMMISMNKEAEVWLKRKSVESGATKAGVLRMLILKEMVKEETKNGKRVKPKRTK